MSARTCSSFEQRSVLLLLDESLERRILLTLCSTESEAEAMKVRRTAASLMQVCRQWKDALRQLSRRWRGEEAERPSYARTLKATSPGQLASLAERPFKWSLYETVSLDKRDVFFKVSCRPITKRAEDDMELLSDLVTWGERFKDHWQQGVYHCARCQRALYASADKFSGPCGWPSWRRPIARDAVATANVDAYNAYTCAVREIYCHNCDLFIGHMFDDARTKGDKAPDARWRH